MNKAASPPSPLLFLAFCGFLALTVFSEVWLGLITRHPVGDDYLIYFNALHALQEGRSPYWPYNIGTSFIYHPFALSALSAFAWMGVWPSFAVWTGLSAGAWGLSIYLSFRLIRILSESSGEVVRRVEPSIKVFLLFAFMGFAPFWETLHIGQVNAFVVLFLLLTLYFAETDRPLPAGLSLTLAMVFKLSPVIFLLYFLVLRRFRIALFTVAGLVLVSMVPAIQFSPGILADFASILPRLGGEIHPEIYNQSLLSLLYRLFAGQGGFSIAPTLLLLHRALFALILLPLMVTGLRIPRQDKAARIWFFLVLLVLMVFFSPLVWYHHSGLLLLPLLVLFYLKERGYFALGLLILALIQVERVFEQFVEPFAYPVFLAQLILLGVLIGAYVQVLPSPFSWLRYPRQVRPAPEGALHLVPKGDERKVG